MNIEEEGNAYTCLGTHLQEFTRKRTHKKIKGSNKKGRLLKYVCIFECMYKFTRGGREVRNEDVDGKESRYMRGVIRTSIGTVKWVSIKFVEEQQRKQTDGDKERAGHKTFL